MYNFLKIDQCAKKILKDIDVKIEPCPDQVRGRLVNGVYEDKDIKRVTNFVDYELSKERLPFAKLGNEKLESVMAIILESPHTDEFELKDGKLKAIGPAQGKTGIRFKEKFEDILKGSDIYQNIKEGIYPIVILNAIQFQCSCGNNLQVYKNKKARDKNWVACFKSECLNDLKLRLQALQPCAIINLCTKGLHTKSRPDLQSKLNEYISEHKCLFPNAAYAIGYHPSIWWNSKCAKINNISEV